MGDSAGVLVGEVEVGEVDCNASGEGSGKHGGDGVEGISCGQDDYIEKCD